ncbi:MAG: hypothetical protein KGY75_07850, partial [Candidatus Cloacimonetes bacterium]|nr:hypothetical protein [Candidatus Cloacimonadota bacterium]
MIKNNKYPLLLLLSLLLLISSSIFAKTTTENIERLEQSQQAKHLQKLNRLPNSVVEKLQAGRKKQDPTQILRKNYDVNLLLLLVDFIPDDDPKTTGNGKFDYGNYDIVELDGKLDSIRTICSPPHDSTYFHTLITAMQYYYQSASLGALNFDNFNFRIFPTQADTAYHLPNKMAYYFPDTDDWDFKTERLIQSFKDIIKTADTTNFANTPDINFSEYTDIMIIHAGSDWQHDIFGDTPCDLPAMYVELEDDSVAVDNDSTYVKSAGFSPETISQDFYKDKNILYGFGSVTSELFHEFGHSLGFVDLYNTILNIPAVGYWDIMDSGGLPMVTTIDSSMGKPDTIAIEGALPTLPSAWSRNLIWGEYFEEHGKCITVTSPTEGNLYIDAAEIPDASNPQFVKIPINNSEYYLLENRQTDLNGDGAPLLKLDASGRVPMYPADPETEEINYEFDFMLPTWDNFKKANTNGGLCIWHVDDHIIYEETVISDGKVYNRFDANRINSQYNNRGVKLVEADGIKDIGNLNSFRPYGTPYEAFFRVKAGEWSPTDTNRFHNYHFGSETKPATFSNADVNSHIEIFDISNASSTMSFKFQYDFYHNLTRNKIPSKFNTTNEILVFEDNYYDSQNILYTSDSTLFVNNDLFGKFTYNFNSAL